MFSFIRKQIDILFMNFCSRKTLSLFLNCYLSSKSKRKIELYGDVLENIRPLVLLGNPGEMSMVTSRWTGIPPRGVAIPPVTSCYRHWDELRQNGATWLECSLPSVPIIWFAAVQAMPTFFLSKLTKLANISIEKINCSQNRGRIKSKIKMMMLFWVPRLRGVAFVSPIFF